MTPLLPTVRATGPVRRRPARPHDRSRWIKQGLATVIGGVLVIMVGRALLIRVLQPT